MTGDADWRSVPPIPTPRVTAIAASEFGRRVVAVVSLFVIWWVLAIDGSATPALVAMQSVPAYRIDSGRASWFAIQSTFSADQLGIVEKLNRSDRAHLSQLRQHVVPDRWLPDELAYSPMPSTYPSAALSAKLLVVHLPGQMFGAYEFGTLVRWGPVSSGVQTSPTPAGLYFLNWKSEGHRSTVNPEWFMRWYFNVNSQVGLALHAYALPGRPASHGCMRLLERDAKWLFDWGDEWQLDASGTEIFSHGTPVFVLGAYDFTALPPWRSIEWLSRPVDLPFVPPVERGT